MKLKMPMIACVLFVLLFAGCPSAIGTQSGSNKPSNDNPPGTAEQQKADAEAAKVTLTIIGGAGSMTAGELTQAKITAAGYDAASYAIKYETVKSNPEKRKADITFFLKKEGIESAKRTVTITGFKAPSASATEQETINKEVDKITLTVTGKESITADELPVYKDKINASGYDTAAYTINYTVIKHDAERREAEITFRLERADLHSKTKTVIITGFKEKVLPPETIDITEQQILALFDLTETKITASAAAKKIAQAVNTAVDGFFFEEAAAVAYNDEKGTFTVKVKGTKDGKGFDKEFIVTGFTHPYNRQLWGVDKSDKKGELKLDAGIEKNLSIKKFIEKANADNGSNIKNFFVNTLAFSLSDGTTIVTLGETDGYKLTAQLKEEGTDKIKIVPIYTIKMHKKPAGGTETVEDKPGDIGSVTTSLIRDYFKADDVFEYVLSKTNDHFVKVDTEKFASYYYAMSKFGNTHPVQFDTAQIQKYVDAYAEKDGNKHLKLGLIPGIHNPAGGGISADDFTGELTVTYCLATAEQLEQQSGITHTKTVIRGGFQKIDSADDALKNHFTFTVIVTPLTAASKSTWIRRTLKYARLFQVEDNSAQGVVTNPLPRNDKPYYLTVNSEENIGATFGAGNYGLSKDTNGRFIYIETITINKTAGEEEFTVSMQLCGNHSIDITTKPFFGHGTP